MNRATVTRVLLKRVRKFHQFLIHAGLHAVSRAKAEHRRSLAGVERAAFEAQYAADAALTQAYVTLHQTEAALARARRHAEDVAEACAAERAVLGL